MGFPTTPKATDEKLHNAIRLAETYPDPIGQHFLCESFVELAYGRWSIDTIQTNYPIFYTHTVMKAVSLALSKLNAAGSPSLAYIKKPQELVSWEMANISKILQNES